MSMPSLAVIIPHYSDLERLSRCLTALVPQLQPDDELVVVDNNSPVPIEDVASRFQRAVFVVEMKKGAAHARNRGVAETKAPLLAFIDSDCLPAVDWVAMARKTALRTDGDLFGGRVDVFDETPPPRSGAEAFETVFAFNFQRYIEQQGFTGAGNLVTRRTIFEDVGGFTNGVSEDKEWSMRAVSKGYKLLYEKLLIVSHPTRQDWEALRAKWLRMTWEAFELEGKNARVFWSIKAFAMPFSALVHLPKLLMSPRLSGPGERLRGATTLIRLRLARMGWMLRQVVGRL